MHLNADRWLFSDAILLGTRRISHGYSLPRHPLLEKICKERQIMIESCPLSDESLRLTNSANAHTLPMLLAKGVSASLNCDDPFLLGEEMIGVSMEFFMCIWSWDNLDLGGLVCVFPLWTECTLVDEPVS